MLTVDKFENQSRTLQIIECYVNCPKKSLLFHPLSSSLICVCSYDSVHQHSRQPPICVSDSIGLNLWGQIRFWVFFCELFRMGLHSMHLWLVVMHKAPVQCVCVDGWMWVVRGSFLIFDKSTRQVSILVKRQCFIKRGITCRRPFVLSKSMTAQVWLCFMITKVAWFANS